MAEQSGEKSFEATPHRREQAREKGQVPYSQDLGSAILLLAAAGLMRMYGGKIAESLLAVTQRLLTEPVDVVGDQQTLVALSSELLNEVGGAVVPLMGMLMLAAIGTSIGQVGFLFVPEKLMPDVSRLSPAPRREANSLDTRFCQAGVWYF